MLASHVCEVVFFAFALRLPTPMICRPSPMDGLLRTSGATSTWPRMSYSGVLCADGMGLGGVVAPTTRDHSDSRARCRDCGHRV